MKNTIQLTREKANVGDARGLPETAIDSEQIFGRKRGWLRQGELAVTAMAEGEGDDLR